MREAVQRPERFSEEEVQQLLHRAAQLQQQDSRVPTEVRALSLEELEQIAADSGIDVQQIHRAILELKGRPRAGSVLLGAPERVHLERMVGLESPSGAIEPLVSELNRALGTAGQVSAFGGTLTWSASNTSSGPVDVTISPIEEGGTRIELNASFGGLLGATFGGIGGGLGGGLGIPLAAAVGQLTQSWAAAGGTIALALGLPLLLARFVYATIVRRRIRRLEQLMDQLSERLSAVPQTA